MVVEGCDGTAFKVLSGPCGIEALTKQVGSQYGAGGIE